MYFPRYQFICYNRRTGSEIYDYPTSRIDKEEIVKFIHARLPCVPIKVIRANSFEPEAKVYRMRTNDAQRQLVGAIVFKDHDIAEFREVKYFATSHQGSGYGRKLMDALKSDGVDARLFYIVLYASNTAVQFFQKQHFNDFPSQICGLSKTVVLSRIEQYQRSTLMACDLLELFPSSFKSLETSVKIGDRVLVSHGLRHARDEEAEVIGTNGPLKIKVTYPRWTADSDEWIVTGAKRLKLCKAAPVETADPVDESSEKSAFGLIKRIRII